MYKSICITQKIPIIHSVFIPSYEADIGKEMESIFWSEEEDELSIESSILRLV
jgi:hypothetical protein